MNTNERLAIEKTILATMLKSESGFMDILNWGTTKDIFHVAEHRLLFAAAMECFFERGKIPSVSAVYEQLLISRADTSLREYLKANIANAHISSLVIDHIKRIVENNLEKDLKDQLSKTGGSGLDYAMAVSEIATQVISKHTQAFSGTVSNKQMAQRVIEDIEKSMRGERSDYIPTGFNALDQCVLGIPKKLLTIIAARPGCGKSAFMLQLMRNFRAQGIKCGVFSMEMPANSLWIRNISAITKIDSLKIESGKLTADELQAVHLATAKLATEDYIIEDSPVQSADSLRAKINLWKNSHKVDVVLIDYLTLIDHKYNKERYDLNISKLTADLRVYAKQSGIPIILLSQLNRAVESRADKRPMLSDLRESGSIEQDAALVLFIHRPDLYGINPFKDGNNKYWTNDGFMLQPAEYAEILIGKARSGKIGTVPLRYRTKLHAFEDVRLAHGADNGNTNSAPAAEEESDPI